jgi:hypothetical protein
VLDGGAIRVKYGNGVFDRVRLLGIGDAGSARERAA